MVFTAVSMDWLDYLSAWDFVLKKFGENVSTFPPDIVQRDVICLNSMLSESNLIRDISLSIPWVDTV